MYSNTTSLHIKIEPGIKQDAQKAAEDLGLSLSAVTKVLLKQFVRTRRLSVDANDRPEIPNDYFKKSIAQSEEDIKAGRTRVFGSHHEVRSYLNTLIANDGRKTK